MNRKKEQSLSTELLASSLRSFLTSPRGQLLSPTRVGPLVGSRSKKLSRASWDEVISILPSLTPTDLSKIEKFIASNRVPNSSQDELEPLKRSDAQGQLEESFKLLSKVPKEKLSTEILKTFLPTDGPSAPFEEVLTFSQFKDLGFENIIRKRGITSEKMFAFAKAINSFLETSLEDKPSSHSLPQTFTHTETSCITFRFENSNPLASVAISGLISGVTDGLPTLMLQAFSQVVTGDSLGALLLGQSNDILASKSSLDVLDKVDAVLKARFDLFRQGVRTLISGPGIPLYVIASLLVPQSTPTSADLLLTKICTLAVGGRNPNFLGEVLDHLFTLNPTLGDSLVKKLKNSSDPVTDLHQLLPNFPLELISRYIKGESKKR